MADQGMELKKAGVELAPAERRAKNYPALRYASGRRGSDTIDLWDVWRKVRKHRWLILSLAAVVTTLVTVEMYRTRPWYEAATVVEVGKETPALLRSGEVTINDDSDPYYLVNVKTKMLLLNSYDLREDVIVNLRLDQDARFFDINQGGSLWGMIRGLGRRRAPEPTAAQASDQAALQLESELARPAAESQRLAPYVEVLNRNLNVEQIRDTRAIRISFTHTDPFIAAAVVSNLVQNFMQRNFQSKTERFTSAADWLDRMTRELKAKVEQAEQALADYTRANNIFSTDFSTAQGQNKETLTTEKLTRLHDQFIRTQTERLLKQSLYEEVKAGRLEQLPEAYADQRITTYQKELTELTTLLAELRVKYGPQNPKVLEARQQMVALQQKVDENLWALEAKLSSEYERAVRDEQALGAALEVAKREALQENQAAIKYSILKQDVETARSLYTGFLQKTNQARAQVAEQYNNVRILQRAQVPMRPEGPRRLSMILAGLVLGLGGGVGLALLIEYLDNTVKNSEDVQQCVQLPTLGVIPLIAGPAPLLPAAATGAIAEDGADRDAVGAPARAGRLSRQNRQWAVAEAYRALRTSILLSAAGSPPKTILVTSGQPGEGKTTTVINTAVSLAQLGASVLVIDCDLRRPTTHKSFGEKPRVGLSTYLSRDIEVDGLIQSLPIPNLFWLPSGPVPPNPAELISSPKMKELLALLARRYDQILIDSPPLINVTDPVILSTMVDGVILVVRGGNTRREVVLRGCHELASVGAKIFGVVLNSVNLRREGYDHYYDRYYKQDGEEGGRGAGLGGGSQI